MLLFRFLYSLKALTLPPELPTLEALVNLAAEFAIVDLAAAAGVEATRAAAAGIRIANGCLQCCMSILTYISVLTYQYTNVLTY